MGFNPDSRCQLRPVVRETRKDWRDSSSGRESSSVVGFVRLPVRGSEWPYTAKHRESCKGYQTVPGEGEEAFPVA